MAKINKIPLIKRRFAQGQHITNGLIPHDPEHRDGLARYRMIFEKLRQLRHRFDVVRHIQQQLVVLRLHPAEPPGEGHRGQMVDQRLIYGHQTTELQRLNRRGHIHGQ